LGDITDNSKSEQSNTRLQEKYNALKKKFAEFQEQAERMFSKSHQLVEINICKCEI